MQREQAIRGYFEILLGWLGWWVQQTAASQSESDMQTRGGRCTDSMYFQVNWPGQPAQPAGGKSANTWGWVLGKTAMPRGKGGGKRVTANGSHDWEGQASQGKWQTGSGGTSTRSWEQNICHFGLWQPLSFCDLTSSLWRCAVLRVAGIGLKCH